MIFGRKKKKELRASLKRDEEHLSHPEKWGFDSFERQRIHVKTWGEKPQRFGVVYADEPLKVWPFVVSGITEIVHDPEEFESVEKLVDVWMVD